MPHSPSDPSWNFVLYRARWHDRLVADLRKAGDRDPEDTAQRAFMKVDERSPLLPREPTYGYVKVIAMRLFRKDLEMPRPTLLPATQDEAGAGPTLEGAASPTPFTGGLGQDLLSFQAAFDAAAGEPSERNKFLIVHLRAVAELSAVEIALRLGWLKGGEDDATVKRVTDKVNTIYSRHCRTLAARWELSWGEVARAARAGSHYAAGRLQARLVADDRETPLHALAGRLVMDRDGILTGAVTVRLAARERAELQGGSAWVHLLGSDRRFLISLPFAPRWSQEQADSATLPLRAFFGLVGREREVPAEAVELFLAP